MFNYKFDRLNEVTREVENFLKYNNEKVNNNYKVDKDMFLNTLTDVTAVERRDYIEFEYNFLNKRINQKYYQLYNSLDDMTTREDLFSQIVLLILEELEGKNYINVNYDNYFYDDDDISRILFLIDRRVKGRVLEEGGMEYNPNTYSDDEDSRKYFAKYGRDLIWLDEDSVDADGNTNSLSNTIGEDEVVKQVGNNEDNYMAVDRLIERAGLTRRQEEVLRVLMYCEFNHNAAAKELEVSRQSIGQVLGNVRDRFERNIYQQEDEKVDTLVEFDNLLNKDNIAADEIILFAKNNISDANIEEMIYSLDDNTRKLFIKYYNGDNIFLFDKEKIAKGLLQYHYNRKK